MFIVKKSGDFFIILSPLGKIVAWLINEEIASTCCKSLNKMD